MHRTLLIPLLGCALAFSFTAARAQQSTDKKSPQKFVKDGVEIEFTVEPPSSTSSTTKTNGVMAGEDAVFRFKIRDTTTKTPLSGIRPAAWIAQRERRGPPGPDQCRAKVESYLQGSLRSRPDVDLNAYYLLALNDEASISVIDPLLGFGGSKLLTLVVLKSPGDDWALMGDRSLLFVSMPLINQVAVVDTNTWKVVSNIDTGAKPKRLALQPDEKYLWVANESGVAVIDTASSKIVKQIATGAGYHEIVFGSDNKFAFVSNRDDGTLSIINVAKLEKVNDVKTGAPASSLSFSTLSKALYVTNDAVGSITVVDSASHKVLTTIAAKPGIANVRFARGGRWGFAPNPKESIVYVFDASTNRLVHEQPIANGPDQIAFTDNFAYVRSLGTEQVSAIRLATLGEKLDIVTFPGGQNAPSMSRALASSADAFVAAPEPGAMLFANPADKMIYYYSEGMAAPMGNFQNYRRSPRAVRVVDRSLREESLGVYSTTARFPKEGVYNVSLLIDSPRVVHCFEAVASSNPSIMPNKTTALRIEYLNRNTAFVTGEESKIRFRLLSTETKKPDNDVKDVGVLVFLSPGMWQERKLARAVGDGVYEVSVTFPESGVYLVFVESPSKRVGYRELPYLTLHAKATAPVAQHHPQHHRPPSPPPPPDEQSTPAAKYFTDVELLDQDGRKVKFYSDVIKGKTVIINALFTTCTGVCPPMSRNFEKIQQALGDRLGKDVFLVSLTVDPQTDTPVKLKEYARKFHARSGWTFLTGKKENLDWALYKLGQYVEEKTQHTAIVIIGNESTGLWKKAFGLASADELMKLVEEVMNDKGAAASK